MAEPNDLPPGGGGTARPGDAIGGQPTHKKKKEKCPVGTGPYAHAKKTRRVRTR